MMLSKVESHIILDYLMVCLVLFLPFSKALPNILIIPAGLLFVYRIFKLKKINISVTWIILIFLLVIILFGAVFQNQLMAELNFQKKFITALLAFILINHVKNKKLIEYSLVISCSISIIFHVIYGLIKINSGLELDLSYGNIVNELLIIERPYFALITVFSSFFMLKWIRDGKSKWFYILVFSTSAFCFYISAKMGIILHVFILCHHFFKSLNKFTYKHFLILAILSTIFVIGIISNPNLKKRLRVQTNIETTIQKYKEFEIRTIIWECSSELLEKEWLFGFKTHENLVPKLTDCYLSKINPDLKPKKYEYYRTEKFNTHNQFLDIFLISGIFGFIVFLCSLLYPIVFQTKNKEFLVLLFLFICFMAVENIFQRQLGCFLFGIFLGLYAPKDLQISWSK